MSRSVLPRLPLAACAGALMIVGAVAAPSDARSGLAGFADCGAFRDHMRALAEDQLRAFAASHALYGDASQELAGGGEPEAPRLGDRAPTGTNLQEAGVDEPDLVKVDGTRVLTVSRDLATRELRIVDASGPQPRLLGSLDLGASDEGQEFLVLPGHRVLVISATYARWSGWVPDTPSTRLTLVDAADPARPTVLRSALVSGEYVTARLRDGVVRVVTATQPRVALSAYREGEPDDATWRRNVDLVRGASADDWLPRLELRDAADRVQRSAPLVGCTRIHRAPGSRAGTLLSVLTVDTLATGAGRGTLDDPGAEAVLAGSDLVYASAGRLYVAAGDGASWDREGNRDRTSYVTRILAFDTTGRSASPPAAWGSVPGHVVGRWAFSEYRGLLRVAVTAGPPWGWEEGAPAADTSVVVLAERGRRLRQVGSVGGLGRGEEVQAVRWSGDRAVVVTFRQTDPLYVVDLSAPRFPRVLGELRVPGFFEYLHPVGNGRLLGVGQDADSDGMSQGLRVAAFDVRDAAAPARTGTASFPPNSSSFLENDSRAFAWLPERRLAVLPITLGDVQVPAPRNCRDIQYRLFDRGLSWDEVSAALVERCGPRQASGGYATVGFTVGPDGALRESGRYLNPAAVWRAVPVGGRLAAVRTDGLALLDPDGLRELGSVRW